MSGKQTPDRRARRGVWTSNSIPAMPCDGGMITPRRPEIVAEKRLSQGQGLTRLYCRRRATKAGEVVSPR
jgi:hypothetical protein